MNTNQNEIILYQPDSTIELEVRFENENVWLTQAQIAVLFGTERPAITKHLNNIYKSDELDEYSTCSILEHVGNESKQTYQTKYYNLDAILSVGYRVNSRNATLFRKWATQILSVFFEGQIFDAYVFVSDLIKSAKKSIILIDNYIDESVLLLLSKRRSKVDAKIYTKQILTIPFII